MKRFLTAIAALTMLLSSIDASAGKVITDSLYSQVLGATVKYNVYLPESFDQNPDKKYPVTYLLHGLTDNYTAWQEKGRMRYVADELMRSGESCEMVIIMPDAGGRDTRNVWNGYFNMPGWNYEDFFFQEFLPSAEAKYRCVSDKGHRAVMGLSMGGGGSAVYCQRHPDQFSSCVAMSAWIDNRYDQVRRNENVKDKLYHTVQSVIDHSALDFLDNADETAIEALRTVKWLIDCGDDDPNVSLAADFHLKMRAAGIKSELRIRDGIHSWEYWHNSLRIALPFASRNFDGIIQ